MKERYFDSERLKEDLYEDVIAEMREDMDSAARQMLRDIDREQQRQAKRMDEIEKKVYAILLMAMLVASLTIEVLVLHYRNQRNEDRIDKMWTVITEMDSDIESIEASLAPEPQSTSTPIPTPTTAPMPHPIPAGPTPSPTKMPD
ncbi:hypothetical protein IKE19_02890 [Candidatus Saccharibacteria bacterium]|nr:hypothetical protein [Candidatus Saccharibacteria bacterium]